MANDKRSTSNRDKETIDAAESFDFIKENNNDPYTSEFFVYHFESKPLSKEDNNKQLGREENADVSKAKEVKTEDYSKRQDMNSGASESASTSSAGASSSATETAATSTSSTAVAKTAGTVVETAAVTITTAVVVVGGGMIIYNQTVDKPQICEINSLELEFNKIYYKLSIGNDEEQIKSGVPGEDCDIVLELTSYTNELIDSAPVKNYGLIEGVFENEKIVLDDEYTLSVYQMSLMDIHKELLVSQKVGTHYEPTSSSSEESSSSEPEISSTETSSEDFSTSEEPPYTPDSSLNKVTFKCEIDQNDTPHYYIDIDYDAVGNYYSDFSIQYFDANNTNAVSDEITLPEIASDWQEINTPNDFELNGTYNIHVYCMSSYPPDLIEGRRGEEGEGKKKITLFTQEVDFSTVEVEHYTREFSLTFDAYKYSYGKIDYYATFSYTDTKNYYSDFYFEFYVDGVLKLTATPANVTGQKTAIELPGVSINGTYVIKVKCQSISPYDYHNDGSGAAASATIEFGQTEIDFNRDVHLEKEAPAERNLEFYKYLDMYEDVYLYANLSYEDDQGYYSDFSLIFKADNFESEEVVFEEYDPGGVTQEISFAGMDLEETYDVEIWCMSTNPYEDQIDPRFDGDGAGETEAVKVLFKTIEDVDFSTLSQEVEHPSFDPSATFDKHVDSFLNETLYVTLLYYDYAERYGNFYLIFGNDDDIYRLSSPYNNERQIVSGFDPKDHTGTETVQVWCERTSYTNQSGYDTIKLFETTIDYDNLQEEREPIDKSLEYHQLDFTIEYDVYQIPHYYVQLLYEDENNYYSNFVLEFFDSEELEEPIGEFTLSNAGTYGYGTKQEITEDDVPLSNVGVYTINVYCESTNPRDEEEEEAILWFTEEDVDFAEVDANALHTNPNVSLSFERRTEANLVENLYVTLAYDDPDDQIFAASIGIVIDDEEHQMMVPNPNTGEPSLLNLNNAQLELEQLTGELEVRVYGNRSQDGANYLMDTQTIDFDDIDVTTADPTDNIFFKKYYRQNGEELYQGLITFENENEYYSYFTITLLDDQEEEVSFASFPDDYLGGSYVTVELDLPDPLEYEVVVKCYSTDPDDIANDPQGVNHSGGPAGESVEIELMRKTIDFSDILVEYEPYQASSLTGFVIQDYLSYYGAPLGRYTTLTYSDPCNFWSEFSITINDLQSQREYTSFSFEAESGVHELINDPQYQSADEDYEMELILYARSFDPTIENQTADGTLIELQTININFATVLSDAMLSSEVPYMTFSVTTTMGNAGPETTISATIYYDFADRYAYYYLMFTPSTGGNDSYEDVPSDFESGVAFEFTNFNDSQGSYLVQLMVYKNGQATAIYAESIDFSQLS